MNDATRRRKAIERRNATTLRVRRLTFATAAAATAAAGVIAGVTATSGTVAKKAVRQLLGAGATSTSQTVPAVPEPTATVASGGASPSAPASAPSAVPTTAQSPAPVAVSGGS
jgi:hypothetical protein